MSVISDRSVSIGSAGRDTKSDVGRLGRASGRQDQSALTEGTPHNRKGLIANAIWNVVNGGSSAIVALLVPPFLTRLLSPDAFGAWAVALQIGTYVGLFGFGLQMAVGRYVAYAEARDDIAQRDGVVSTAFWFLVIASVVGWIAICTTAGFVDRILPHLHGDLKDQTRAAIILVGLALAINLPASIFAAVFTGQQRSDVPAKIQGTGRICLALGLIGAGYTHSLTVLGLVYATISILTSMILWYAWRTRTIAPDIARRNMSRSCARELAGFCFSLTVWNFSMVLVAGLDLLIIGRWDYNATPYYAVSAALVSMVAGLLTSLTVALVPAAASLTKVQIAEHVLSLLERASFYILCISTAATLILFYFGHFILCLWLGAEYAEKSTTLLAVLAVGIYMRMLMLPYTTIAIALGFQNRILAAPLVEGFASVIFSLIFVPSYGAVAVAFAKPISATSAILLLGIQHPLREVMPRLSRTMLLRRSFFAPTASMLSTFGLTHVLLEFGTLSPFVSGATGVGLGMALFAIIGCPGHILQFRILAHAWRTNLHNEAA